MYSEAFDRFEYLYGLISQWAAGWGPVGRFGWRRADRSAADVVTEHQDELLQAGFFDRDIGKLDEVVQAYGQNVERLHFMF